ncbi:MAG: TRAP transporter substrate-binding protein [Lachnospiraceae bacterium]|nr:TRAP transporter substrate-binding protein [Lachnospiraceae bacterium]
MKKLAKLISLVAAITLVISVFSGCAQKETTTSSTTPATTQTKEEPAKTEETKDTSEETITLKFAHVVADNHPYNLGALKFKELLEANSPEPVTVEIFANGALGGERELAEGLQMGTLDIALIPGAIGNFSKAFSVLNIPHLFRDNDHVYKVLDGEIGQELAAALPEEAGFRLLSYWENGWRNMTNSKRPIYSPEDVKGLTMRVPEDRVYTAYFEELGANVVVMAFTELYTALQQKTVDGQENPVALIATNKLYEAQKYLSLTKHFYGPAHVCISETTWKNLSDDMQKAIQDAASEACTYERGLISEYESSYLDEIKAAGTEVNEVDKSLFQQSAENVWAKFEDEYGDTIRKIQAVK